MLTSFVDGALGECPMLLYLMMCTAGKVTYVKAMYGTYFNAFCATRAKRIIDDGKIVDYSNGTVGAGLFALHATNTSVGTVFARLRTLVVTRTFDDNRGGVVDQFDQVVGAGSDADAASDTKPVIYLCNAVLY